MLEETMGWLIGALILPEIVWLIRSAAICRKAEPDSSVYRRYRTLLRILTVLGIVIAEELVRRTIRWGFDTVFLETVLLVIFLGLPLTAISIFIPALIGYKHCPKDSPERKQYKRTFIISGICAVILTAAFVTLLIMAFIGLMHM